MLSSHHLISREKTRRGFSHSVGCVCLILLASTVQWARADVQLLALAGNWRYQQTTNLDGVNWQAPIYDDSNWPTGAALLYVESNALVSPRNTPLTLGRTTYYFRTHFTFPFEPTNLIVTFSARIDDGAVIYLNGQEIQRIRMATAPVPISYTNLATTTPPGGDATSSDTFALSGASLSNFLTGDNLLAVEVHQNATNSDDIVFGTAVVVTFTNSPPIVVQQPADVSVLDGRAATLTAIIDGSPSPALQWFKDFLPVPGATNSWLVFTAANPTNDGTYWLAATNSFGGLTTSNALLRVLADTNPPVIVSALASKNLTNITVTFSEAVLSATATNKNNFEVFQTRLPSNHLDVASVSLSGSAGVVLKTTARTSGLNYSLRVNGIRDSSSVSNQIAPNSEFTLSYQVDLMAVDAQTTWRYLQGGFDPGTNWVRPDFDASAWQQGAAVFAGGTPTPSGPDPVRTALSLTASSNAVVTYYFRTFFDLPGPMITNSFRMHDIADDGAIFYLNGSEVFSVGMPTTRPVTYSTSASRTVGTAAYEPSLSSAGWSLPETNLTALNDCFATELHQRTNSMADTAFAANLEAVISHYNSRPSISVPASALEGAVTLTNQGQVTILEPVETNLVLQLSSSRPADVAVPDTVTILAGATNAAFDLVIGDDTLVNGPRAVTVRVGGTNVVPAAAIMQVLDNETNTISISIASSTVETNGTLPGEVRFAQPAVTNITVTLASSDVTALKVPPSVIMTAGMTSAVFQATVVDDALIDGPQAVTLSASVAGWPTGAANVVVDDNEPKTVAVILPANVVEGAGTLVSAGKVQLAGIAVSNLTVALSSSLPGLVSVASNITVNAGQSNAFFDLALVDNTNYEPARIVVISAAIAGFTPGSNIVTVLNDDAHHFGFSTIGSPQDTATPFNVTVTARNLDGTVVTNFKQSVTLLASSLNGSLPVEPAGTGPFNNGQWSGSVRVTTPGKLVRLSCTLAPGESNPFHVVPPPFRKLAQQVEDLAYDPVSGAVLATVSSAGSFENQLVAIDPTTATITNAYNVGFAPGQIDISPSGQFLYVSLSNNYALRRMDLVTHSMGSIVSYGTSADGPLRATDFAVVGGMPDSVVVALASLQYYGSVRRYDSGAPTPISLGGQLYPTFLTCSSTSPVVYGIDSYFSALGRFSVNPVGGVVVTNGLITGAGQNFAYSQGVLYAESGEAVVADTFRLLGKYATAGPVVVDQPTRRALFVDYPNYLNCRIKAYDRDSFIFINSVLLPPVTGVPIRFIRWGTNGLAFNTAYGEVWFVQSDSILPVDQPADLVLAGSAPTQPPVVGSNVTYSITVSNRGPGLATLIRVSNSLPAAVTLVSTTASTGLVTQAGSTLLWDISDLVSGASATLQFSVIHSNPGWHYSIANVAAYEPDFVLTNNTLTLTTYVQAPSNYSGPLAFALATEDILYDPTRDRLLLSLGNTGNAQSNGIAVFDPYTGLIDSFTPIGQKPAKIVRSSGGEFLYVSLKDDALVRQLALPTLTGNLDFTLGGESWYGVPQPYYAADMAAVPDQPHGLVVWRNRAATSVSDEYGRGIAVYDDGIVRSNVTDSGGSWKVEFDTDSRTLVGFNNGDLRRCSLDSNGVSFVESYPPLYSAGDDLEYAAGRFFTTTGREVRYQPFQAAWIFAGAEGASLVEPDAGSGRVFYLTQDNGWRIKAYDMESKALLGSVVVSNVVGTPTSLIRWGTNGLAFRTAGNQVFIVRTPLAQTESAADLAIQIEGPDAPVAVGSDALFILTLTNRGPQPAGGMTVTNSFSPSVSIDWVFCTDGSIQATHGRVVWSLPALDAGKDSFAAVVIRSMQTGVVSIVADVMATTLDFRRGDNSAFTALQVDGSPGLDRVVTLAVPAQDMVWSPSLGRLLATTTANLPNWSGSLLSIDPVALAVRFESALGADAGRMAISRDDSILYAGVDRGVCAITIPGLVVTNHFLINPTDPRGYAYDMEVVPGANRSVLVGSKNRNDNSTWLGVYDDGIQRTDVQSFYTTGFSLEFGDDPSLFYYQDYNYGGFSRYAVSAQGISLLDTSAVLPTARPIDLRWADGLLYSSLGIVVDPVTRQQVRTIPGITNNSPLCYDVATKRVFYLMPVGTNAVLHAVDAATTVPLGSLFISGFSGSPAGLVRWGANGLAFRTTSGQIALLNSSLVPSDPPTDLGLDIAASDTLAFVGSNFVYSVNVTNLGGNAAANAQIALRVPTNVSVVAASSSQGTAVIGPQQALASLGTLLPGGFARILVTVVPSQPGRILAVASATSSAFDPDLANNSRSLTNPAVLFVARDSVAVLNQAATDLVFNAANGRLYVSGNASSVAVINPALAQVETNWPVPTQPGRLAVSDDGLALYISHDSGRQLARLQTSDGSVLSNFSLGTNNSGAAFTLMDLEVIPGAPGSVVVNEQAGGYRYLAVMDDGVARPSLPQLPYPSNGSFLEYGNDPSVIYLSGLMPMRISSDGVSVLGGSTVFSTASNFKYDSGLFYTDAGQQADPTNRIASTRFTGLGTGTLVATDIPRRRIYFLSQIGSVWQLRAYDPVTTDWVGSISITNVAGTPSALVRWGDDGLAFCTTSSQVFLLRPSFVPGGPGADLQLTQTPTPVGPVSIGSNVTFVVQITNTGPASASSVVLLDRLPTNTTVVQMELSQGTTNLSGGLLTFNLGTITNGGTAQISLTLRPQRAGALVNRVTVTSANLDPDQTNNTITTSVGVQLNLPSDAAGIVDLQTADIDYDPISGLIYASLANYLGAPYENAVVPLDPATGLLGAPIPVAPNLSKLAISDDGSRLYVLANSGTEFRRIQLPQGTADLRVVTDASEIKAVPGRPRSLALVPGSTGVVVYDDAVPRTSALIWYDQIEFFAPDLLLGFWGNMVPNWTARLALTTNGVAVDSGNAIYLVDGTMKADGGLIYTTGGSVIDPMILTKVQSFGVSGPVAPDHTIGRVCFLTGSGSSRILRVFDSHNSVELGNMTITNVAGAADKLVRCGADRLAFRTSSGQVFVLRTSLLPSQPPANLSLVQSANPIPVLVGSNLLYTILVTNSGPYAATNVVISDALPPSATFVSASATSGMVSNYGSTVTCRLNSLANGGSVAVSIVVSPAQSVTLTNIASVTSSSTDPSLTNNFSMLTTAVAYLAGLDSVHEVELSAGDMVYDPISRRIYASGVGILGGAGSSVFVINPENGVIEMPILVGDNPGRLAVSDDGRYLHVGLNGSSTIRRVDLQTRNPDLLFSIGAQFSVQDMVSLAGSPTAVAISRHWGGGTPVFGGTAIYENGIARSNVISTHTGPNAIEPGADGSVLFGYNQEDSDGGFYRMTVNANGVSLVDVTRGLVPAFTGDILYNGGRIYTTDGLVINPTSLATVGSFANIPHASPITVNLAANLAFYLVPTDSAWALQVFRSDTFALRGTITITNVSGSPSHLICCGADRVAFLTTGGQIFVIRTSFIPSADVMVLGSFATNQVMVGETVNLQLIVSNAGPYAVAGVTLTNTLPSGMNLISITASQGTVATNGQVVTVSLGSLATNANATLTLTLVPTVQALGLVTNTAELTAASPPDAVLFNNRLGLGIIVVPTDTDHDGMPDDWELAHGLNPNDPSDALLDSDCDGTSNLQEYQAGTDPFVFDGLRIVSARLTANACELTVHAAVGKTYTVETSTNLLQWSPLITFLCQGDGQKLQVPLMASIPAAFYRLQSTTNAPHPFLALINRPALPTNPPVLQITAPPGYHYALQVSTDLKDWTELTNYHGTACSALIADPSATGFSSRFYRVVGQ
jgi:uncharacterized repeat protein (TIGR01451 family)